MVVSQDWGYLFRGPYSKDYIIFGSILGSPHFGKLPYRPRNTITIGPCFTEP